MERTKNKWNVTLQRDDGEVEEVEFRSFWDPDFENIQDTVGRAAAAEAWWRSGKQFKYAPITAALIS